jgi:regulator of protease activity HflC (stomatin/prohibitin superfamily)
MQKPSYSRIGLFVVLILCLSCALGMALLVMTLSPEYRPLIFALGVVGMIAIAILPFMRYTYDVVEGESIVVSMFGQKAPPVIGPKKVTVYPLFQSVEPQSLKQKPLEVAFECGAKNHVLMKVHLIVVWELGAAGLSASLKKTGDPAELIRRLIESRLTAEIGSLPHDQVNSQAPFIAARIERFLAQPEYAGQEYSIRHVLITQIRPPLEILQSAAAAEVEKNKGKSFNP